MTDIEDVLKFVARAAPSRLLDIENALERRQTDLQGRPLRPGQIVEVQSRNPRSKWNGMRAVVVKRVSRLGTKGQFQVLALDGDAVARTVSAKHPTWNRRLLCAGSALQLADDQQEEIFDVTSRPAAD